MNRLAIRELEFYLDREVTHRGVGCKEGERYTSSVRCNDGVFNLDNSLERKILRARRNAVRLFAEILNEVERVKCLIYKHSAPFFFNSSSPFGRIVIILASFPDDRAVCGFDIFVLKIFFYKDG